MGILGTSAPVLVGALLGFFAARANSVDTAGVDAIASILAAVLLVLAWRAIAGNRVRS
jgi:hypothetical protein